MLIWMAQSVGKNIVYMSIMFTGIKIKTGSYAYIERSIIIKEHLFESYRLYIIKKTSGNMLHCYWKHFIPFEQHRSESQTWIKFDTLQSKMHDSSKRRSVINWTTHYIYISHLLQIVTILDLTLILFYMHTLNNSQLQLYIYTYPFIFTLCTFHCIEVRSGICRTIQTTFIVFDFSQVHVFLVFIGNICFNVVCCFAITNNTWLKNEIDTLKQITLNKVLHFNLHRQEISIGWVFLCWMSFSSLSFFGTERWSARRESLIFGRKISSPRKSKMESNAAACEVRSQVFF